MDTMNIEGVYEWKVINTVTGEVKEHGKGKNKINPKMFYYSFPKPTDTEHTKHHNGAVRARAINQIGLSPTVLDATEYINSGVSLGQGTAPKRLDNLRLSVNDNFVRTSVDTNDKGELCYIQTVSKKIEKGIAGTYHAFCGGFFYINNRTEIYPTIFSVINLEQPLVLTDIDEVTITYSIYQKCPSTASPIVKQVNLNGRQHTLSTVIHAPMIPYVVNSGQFSYTTTIEDWQLWWPKHRVGNLPVAIYTESTGTKIFPNLKYHATSFSLATVLVNGRPQGSTISLGYQDTIKFIENVSEPYPAPVKIKYQLDIPYTTTGSIDFINWFLFGSMMQAECTPTIVKTNEETFHLEWIITHEVPNATQ